MARKEIKRFDASRVLWVLCILAFVVAVIVAW